MRQVHIDTIHRHLDKLAESCAVMDAADRRAEARAQREAAEAERVARIGQPPKGPTNGRQ